MLNANPGRGLLVNVGLAVGQDHESFPLQVLDQDRPQALGAPGPGVRVAIPLEGKALDQRPHIADERLEILVGATGQRLLELEGPAPPGKASRKQGHDRSA